jgi:hypothetical protein
LVLAEVPLKMTTLWLKPGQQQFDYNQNDI